MSNVWPLVHAERRALIDDLADVDEAAWGEPSLCEEWTVHDVAAHLVDSARTTRLRLQPRAGTRPVRLRPVERPWRRPRARHVPRRDPRPTAEVRSADVVSPAPLDSTLVEEIGHGEDIRRPLGLTRAYPVEAVSRALQLQARTAGSSAARASCWRQPARGHRRRVALGDGPPVRGPVLSLVLVACGRGVALNELSGPGVRDLGARMPDVTRRG
ncbi:maleylpyruvate isomerase family mycothiol-dependent enzyme [Motilibacter aurantiacus]|uniref:maleylpyruvate isomerase family mycothiol-dependent enzyme n=1 Tax=Motilibacter aurantiacus TaxID=2714955 RepID=UPI0014085512|nr:maleylpyruvate isomerase family mycothiol-dependent enzyme [Motilibacter aurantiacus]NHC46953.1 maleylpyruvate isomerase family mycothiol-dependent enzyme [Motilibacter aurantiacus]